MIANNPGSGCDEGKEGGMPLLSSEQVSNMTATLAHVKEVSSSISSRHRELHSIVSKVGRAIDKVSTIGGLSTFIISWVMSKVTYSWGNW